MRVELWHGSSTLIDRFDLDRTVDGGIHLGNQTQARMRNAAFLHRVEVELGAVRRSLDRGGDWKDRIARARSAGFGSIVYLNRYEGISSETIARFHGTGDLARLDRLSDSAFRKLVPEAMDSYIILDPDRIRILEVVSYNPDGMDCPPISP